MGAFTLTNSALLAGLAMLSAPILVHLLQRRARKPIVFPTIAFLRQTAAQQSRLHKLRRFLLLLLRLAAVACVVLAFTRPLYWQATAAAGSQSAATATVILLDASLSTSQLAGDATVFDKLRSEALRELNQLRPGIDVAAVVRADDDPDSVFPRLTANLPALAEAVSTSHPSSARADLPAALNLATRLALTHIGPKRLVLLTDRQRTNWKPQEADSAELRVPDEIEVHLPQIDWDVAANGGLSATELLPQRPRAGGPVELSVVATNDGTSRSEMRIAANWISGSQATAIASESVLVDAGKLARVAFPATAPEDEKALPAVRFDLSARDGLPGDDVAWAAASLGRGIPVVVASDDSIDEPGTAAFYIVWALSPFDDQNETHSNFSPQHVVAGRLTAADLAEARIVLLGYAGVLKTEAAKAIAEFVRKGGALVVFAGDGPADRNLQLINDAAGGALAPWLLSQRVDAPRRSPALIHSGRWSSRWLRDFDEASQLALREIAFRRTWSSTAPAAGTEVLLSFANESPALGLRNIGRGFCVVANFSPEASAGDLGKTGSWVALVQMLAGQLAGDEGERTTFLVGERPRFRAAVATGSLEVLSPDGKRSPATRSDTDDFVGVRSSQPGLYSLWAGQRPVAIAAVNVDARESRLAALSHEEILKVIGHAPGQIPPSRDVAPAAAGVRPLDGGQPLWGGFLLAGLAAIGLELFLLGLWRR